MSMMLAGGLMGLGQGLKKYADDLSSTAKEEAAAEKSLELYRAKKNIDLEFKTGTAGGTNNWTSSKSTIGRPRTASTTPVKNSAAPTATSTPEATGTPGPDGRATTEIYNDNNPDNPAPRMSVPQPSSGGKSLPETMSKRFREEYLKDVPSEDRIRLLRIAENMYAQNSTKTEIEAWISNPSNWGIAETVDAPGPVAKPGWFGKDPTAGPDQPAAPGIPQGLEDPILIGNGGNTANDRGASSSSRPSTGAARQQANAAISRGADQAAVAKRFMEMYGEAL